jgi:hypothetical protein
VCDLLSQQAKGDSVKARLCVLLVILGLAGAPGLSALASDDGIWDGGTSWGYHDGDEAPTPTY